MGRYAPPPLTRHDLSRKRRPLLTMASVMNLIAAVLLIVLALHHIVRGLHGQSFIPWAHLGGAGFVSPVPRIIMGSLAVLIAAWQIAIVVNREKQSRVKRALDAEQENA